MTDDRTARAASFGRAAGEYDRGRPSYPEDAVDWMLPPGARRVADLGAGTGKFTAHLVARGLEVSAIDPSPEMLAFVRAALPGVRALEGTGEDIPLDDASVDVVTAATSWHWVDPDRALPEVARVLVPGGTLSLAWNHLDYTSEWMIRLGEIMREVGRSGTNRGPDAGPLFTPFEHRDFPWVRRVSRAVVLDLVSSTSIFIVSTDDEKREVLERVNEHLDSHPDAAARDEFELAYSVHCFRAVRRA